MTKSNLGFMLRYKAEEGRILIPIIDHKYDHSDCVHEIF